VNALDTALADPDVVWDLLCERDARYRREHERPKQERANTVRQVKRLDAELVNLTRQAARGLDIDVAEFNNRRAQVEAMRLKLAAPAAIQLDRESLQVGLAMSASSRAVCD
jgi:hypothetical protein